MRSASRNGRAGATLAELLVALLLLGLLTTLATGSLAALRPPPGAARLRALEAARAEAIRGGVPLERRLALPGPDATPVRLRFLPDGRVLGPGVDPWTGGLAPSRGAP